MRGSAVFRTGVAPGGALAGPWVRDPLWARARAVPSLDLRFADNKSLVDATTGQNLVTFTRASSGTFVDSAGVLQTAATDAPRFDHNPTTGESLGLLVEEQRTNSLTNNTMVGAVAGTPGTLPTGWGGSSTANGITREIVGTGTEDGITYIDLRFSGTNTLGSNFFQSIVLSNSVVAATGQTWTGSAYVRLLAGAITGASFAGTGGSLTMFGTPSFNDNAGVSIASVSIARLSTQRYSATRTFTNATTTGADWRVTWIIVTGATIDFTLRIGLPQLEQGAFATSAILTTTAAATRSADVCSITGSAFTGFYRQDEGTMFAVARTQQSAATHILVGISTGSFGSSVYFSKEPSNVLVAAPNAAPSNLSISLSSVSSNVGLQVGLAFTAGTGSASAVMNGGTVGTDASTGIPITMSQMAIGNAPWNIGTTLWNGHIKRLTFWPQRLGNQVLQSITQ